MQLKLVPSHFFRPHPAMTKRLLVLRFPVPHVAVHPVHGVQSDSRHLGQSINYQLSTSNIGADTNMILRLLTLQGTGSGVWRVLVQ